MSIESAPGAPPSDRRRALLAAAACAAVTFVVFLPVLRGEFLLAWDDGEFILRNESIRSLGLEAIVSAFSDFKVHYWAPVTWLSFALDHAIWGLDPFGFHLTNLLLHALDAGLVFLLAARLFAEPAVGLDGPPGRFAAALAALAWSLHPLRVEAVAWATERKGLLALAFTLGALLAYLGHVRSGERFWRSRRYGLALGLFCLAVLAKSAMTTVPVVLVLLDVYPLRRPGRGLGRLELAEKVPFLVASALVTLATLGSHSGLGFTLAELGIPARVLIALRSVFDYLRLTVWPAGLSPFYLHPGNVGPGDLSFTLPALAVVAATLLALAGLRRHPALASAWLAFVVGLAPGLLSTQVSATSMADRFTYFPALAPTLLAAGALAQGLARVPTPRLAAAGAVAAAATVVVLAALSFEQTAVWHDEVSLWSRPIELDPLRSGRVYTQRSYAREQRGDVAGARADMDQAIVIAGAKGYRDMAALYWRRAGLARQLGADRAALEDYARAEQGAPPAVRPAILRERASLYETLGMKDLAADDLRRAAEPWGGR
jgi:hypothetical protein